ncbi:glycosyltransferase family 2 protein [Tellurirhabdus bombi]|uniref:glycosyltransferase family 2 protein n=1 Tax=Tellurirhabdus bombi TaxID=2907205 RepID=UPI001F406BB0|nr:glycosyltransferase family 2 protein [Tellurirhabdus bombi]
MTNENIFVIIPAYNEGRVIRQTILSLGYAYQIVVVDDASTDDTRSQLQDLPIYYLRHPINLGQGAALQTGMDFVYQMKGEIAVHFDADGQHNPADIPRFIQKLQEDPLDIVIGSRFLRNEDTQRVPFLKRFILKTATVINGLLTGLWLTDAHNGFRVMNRQALERLQLRENRMAHATEILAQVRLNELRLAELDTHVVYTDYSKLKGQSWTNSFNILFDLVVSKYLR